MITLVKSLLLKLFRWTEGHGLFFSMPRKIIRPDVLWSIRKCMARSYSPITHFNAAYLALLYLSLNEVEGDVVLCGVSHGGLAKFLLDNLPPGRKLWLYDTFDGGTLPGDKDGPYERKHGERIKEKMRADEKTVREYVGGGGNCVFVVGDIFRTIPSQMPSKIALLYLDTDYYETTLYELDHLEPRVSKGGVIIQDDCGLCVGAQKAIDKHYSVRSKPFFVPLSEAGVVWLKT